MSGSKKLSQASLGGRWFLVTGAARRIGAAIARALHGAGANIALHFARSASEAESLSDALNDIRADSARVFQADLTVAEQRDALIARVVAVSGRLDGLINNASTFYPTPIDSVTEQQWDDLVGTNFKAPLFLASAAAPYLRRNQGIIINLVDIHARRPLRDHPIYASAKAALAMLTLALARDLGPEVRVNGISPGAILWPEAGMSETTKREILDRVPLKRAGSPSDIAGCVLFLVRDAGYINGQIIAVDGGRSVGW